MVRVLSTIKTLRPSADAFRKLGWLPTDDKVYHEFITDLTKRTCNETYSDQVTLLQPIRDFKQFIESNPAVHAEFIAMFEGIEESVSLCVRSETSPLTFFPPPRSQPRNYHELCNMFNDIFRRAPYFGDLGPPVYMIMAKIMNTKAGFSAFTRESLNFHFKKLFDTWGIFLSSKASCDVLVSGKFSDRHYGWFSEPARAGMMAHYDGRTFEQVFLCDENAPYHGFSSYDHFFNRRFRERDVDRPVVGGIADITLIGAPCESVSYNVSDNVQSLETLYIKGEAYSLRHLLNNDPFTATFEHGSILQGFLSITAYHRWQSPVNGTIVKIVNVPGTYFAQAPYTIGDPIPNNGHDAPPYLRSLVYFSNIATRQIMFIEADHKDIGLIFVVFIGMTEVSTCEATVCEGQHVKRGDDLGMFHFGGSSFAIGFQRDANIEIVEKYRTKGTVIRVNGLIGSVKKQ